MWDQDWNCSELKMKKLTKKLTPDYTEESSATDLDLAAKNLEASQEKALLENKFEPVMETSTLKYKNQPKVPGYPGINS